MSGHAPTRTEAFVLLTWPVTGGQSTDSAVQTVPVRTAKLRLRDRGGRPPGTAVTRENAP
jgi:hypothetical protein